MRQYIFVAIVVAVAVLLVYDMVSDAINHPFQRINSALTVVQR